jgi:predicted outer membrane protein
VSVLIKLRIAVLFAGICSLVVGPALAQQDRTDQSGSNQSLRSESNQPPSGQSDRPASAQNGRNNSPGFAEPAQSTGASASGKQSREIEQYVAARLLAENEAEVELSRFAQQHATSSEVKEFSEAILQDHQKMIQQLQRLAGSVRSQGQNGRSSATGTADNSTRSTSSPGGGLSVNSLGPGGTTSAPPSAASGSVHQLIQIDRQIIERKTDATRRELQRKSGAEFDKLFVRTAINAHIHDLAALEVSGQQSEGELARIAQQARPTVQPHLDHAKQLMKKLEGDAGSNATASRPSDSRNER